jgi:hypothetical protein
MKYDDLKPRQQDWIRKFYDGLQNEAQELKHTFRIDDAYTRSYIRYMSSKYCDMEWGPAWIVKDKSRVPDDGRVGVYLIPELQEYGDLRDAENHDQAVRDFEEDRATADSMSMS